MPFDSRVMGNLQHAGFTQLDISQRNRKETPHALVSFAILKRHGFDDSVCVIAGGHHGAPPSKEAVKLIRCYKKECGFTETSWISAQDTLLEMALTTTGITKEDALAIKLSRPEQMILSGLVISDKLPLMAKCEASVVMRFRKFRNFLNENKIFFKTIAMIIIAATGIYLSFSANSCYNCND